MGIVHILFGQTTKNLALRDKLVDLVIVNLVLGYHLVLLEVCEEPAVFAALQSTVVRLHMASLPIFITRYSQATILNISIISAWDCYLVGHIPPRPITMLCHIRPANNSQITAK